jgi:hypothetical protein
LRLVCLSLASSLTLLSHPHPRLSLTPTLGLSFHAILTVITGAYNHRGPRRARDCIDAVVLAFDAESSASAQACFSGQLPPTLHSPSIPSIPTVHFSPFSIPASGVAALSSPLLASFRPGRRLPPAPLSSPASPSLLSRQPMYPVAPLPCILASSWLLPARS